MKYACLILFFSSFIACNSNKKNIESFNNSSDIDSIFVTYFCGNIDPNVSIKCKKIAAIQAEHPTNDYSLFSEVIDTFIVENSILDRIKPLLEKGQGIQAFNEDARMYVTVKYTDNTTDNICLGMEAPQVMFNGKPVLIENELVYLLRQYSGYYKWFDESDLEWFPEWQMSRN